MLDNSLRTLLEKFIDKYDVLPLAAPGALDDIIKGIKGGEDSFLAYSIVLASKVGFEPFSKIKMEAWNIYQEQISLLLELIDKRGYETKNHEKYFLDILIEMALEKNYRDLSDEFYLLNDMDSYNISEVFQVYIETIGKTQIGSFRYLSFLNLFLFKKGLIQEYYDVTDLYYLVKAEVKQYDLQKFEQELLSQKEINSNFYRIEEIDRMEGIEFERFLAELLGKLGFRVEITKTSGDQGVDLVAFKRNRKYAIQAKRYSDRVGNKAIQEVVAGQKFYSADKSWVITNSTFTKSAIDLAKRTNTLLWDRNKLLPMLDLMKE